MTDENVERITPANVEFGPLREALREHQYPVTQTELIEVYGGFELEFSGGTDRVEDVLARVDRGSFREPRDVRDALLSGIATDLGIDPAVGDDETVDDDWSRRSV